MRSVSIASPDTLVLITGLVSVGVVNVLFSSVLTVCDKYVSNVSKEVSLVVVASKSLVTIPSPPATAVVPTVATLPSNRLISAPVAVIGVVLSCKVPSPITTLPDPFGSSSILTFVSLSPVVTIFTLSPFAALTTPSSFVAEPVAVSFIASFPLASLIVEVHTEPLLSTFILALIKASLNLAPVVPRSIVAVPGKILVAVV